MELCNIPSVETTDNKIHASTDHCELKFGNPGALATHIKCKHGIVSVLKTPKDVSASKKVIEIDENDVVPDQQQPASSSSSIDSEQQKRKNTEDKYAQLKKKRLSYPQQSLRQKSFKIEKMDRNLTS